MVVASTPNIGLKKPDNFEIAKDWTHIVKLAEQNNLALQNESALPLTNYTPSLRGQTADPNIGSGGAITGQYQNIFGYIVGTFLIRFTDPGIASGTGPWGVSLPFVADAAYHSVGSAFNSNPGTFSVVGQGYVFDNTSVSQSSSVALDLVTVSGVSYVRLLTENHAAKTSRMFGGGSHFAMAIHDRISGNFFYKRA